MRETKTVKGGSDCPTLLHYIARLLLRSDPALVTFIEDMPHLEPAARGEHNIVTKPRTDAKLITIISVVSLQTVSQSITSLVNGLKQVNNELKLAMSNGPTDKFVTIMRV